MEFKAYAEVCKAAGLSPIAMEAAAKIVSEEENIENSSLTVDNLKEYLKKGSKQ